MLVEDVDRRCDLIGMTYGAVAKHGSHILPVRPQKLAQRSILKRANAARVAGLSCGLAISRTRRPATPIRAAAAAVAGWLSKNRLKSPFSQLVTNPVYSASCNGRLSRPTKKPATDRLRCLSPGRQRHHPPSWRRRAGAGHRASDRRVDGRGGHLGEHPGRRRHLSRHHRLRTDRPPATGTAGAPSWHGRRFLVVDDTPTAQNMLSALLGRNGARVDCVASDDAGAYLHLLELFRRDHGHSGAGLARALAAIDQLLPTAAPLTGDTPDLGTR